MEAQTLQHRGVPGGVYTRKAKKHRGWQSGRPVGGGGGRTRARENGGAVREERRLCNGFVSERDAERVQVVAESNGSAQREAASTTGCGPEVQGVRRHQPAGASRSSRNGRRQRVRPVQKNHLDMCTPPPPSSTNTTTTKQVDSSETDILKVHPKLSCSVDSGRGEELSSSCESSFEPTQAAVHSECSQRSRHSSCSDFDDGDDVFEDALSNLPTKDEDGITSSAFVTPNSTRSHSPVNCPGTGGEPFSETALPLEEVCNSLERIREQETQLNGDCSRQEPVPNHSDTPKLSMTGHVTLDSPPTSPTACGEHEERFGSGSATSSTCSSGGAGFYIGEVELHWGASTSEETDDLNFEYERCLPSVKSDADSSSSQSPKKIPSQRPKGLSVVLPCSLLAVDTKGHLLPQHPSSSSLSTASPQSSDCSPSSSRPHSPLTLSPSPSSHCDDEDKQSLDRRQVDLALPRTHMPPSQDSTDGLLGLPTVSADHESVKVRLEQGRTEAKEEEEEEAMDEWPDLCCETQVPRPDPQLRAGQTAVFLMTQAEASSSIMQWFAPFATSPSYSPSSPVQCIHPAALCPTTTPESVHPVAPGYQPGTDGAVPGEPPYGSQCQQQQQPSSECSWPAWDETSSDLSQTLQEDPPYQPPAVTTPDIIADVGHSHPLHTTWVMWYDRITGSYRNKASDYKNSLKRLSTIECVEDFWRLYNNICAPSELENSANYHFFKRGIQPLWEDSANKNGGKWVLTVRSSEILDQAWMELLMALIGEHMDQSNLVNGAVLSRRKKGDRIALWTSRRDKKENLKICTEFVRVLVLACEIVESELPSFIRELAEGRNGLSLVFMHHSDSLKSRTSYQNDVRISLRDHAERILATL